MKIKTNYIWILIAVAVVASIIIFSPKDGSTPIGQMTTTDQVLDTPVVTTTTSVKTTPVATLSYEHALAQYVDKRIQFDSRCQATPSQVTYKNGTSIMLDNRASVARTIKIGNLVVVPAYGFKIIQISSATLPATWLVDCGTSQNVATVVVQK